MIVREIKDNPEIIEENFDWFNDYKDTRNWASRNCPEFVERLEKGWKIYIRSLSKSHNTGGPHVF